MTNLKTVLYVDMLKLTPPKKWKIEKLQNCGLGSGSETIEDQRVLREKIVLQYVITN